MNKFKTAILLAAITSFTFLLAAETMLRIVRKDAIKTYHDSVPKSPRYLINGKESQFLSAYVNDDVLAFKLKPNYSETNIDSRYNIKFSFRTNSDGFRTQEINCPSGQPLSRYTIMALGDSATFGYAVDQDFSYPELMNAGYGSFAHVWNFGVPCYSFAEFYLMFKNYVAKLKPDLIVLGVYPCNDFTELTATQWEGRNQGLLPSKITRTDYFVGDDGYFKRYWDSGLTYRFPVLRNSYLWILIMTKIERYFDERKYRNKAFDPIEASVSIIQDISKSVPVLVVIIPCQYAFTHHPPAPEFVAKLALLENVDVLDLSPSLLQEERYKRFYVEGSHFNEEGNAFAAERIMEYIRSRGLLASNSAGEKS